ncbi:MAG: hypothetical protein HY351_03515 [Candidatus Omnitrophica bacterium]|nr:hypothetical protein [Candidatus Omnitrophota bacterium]
MRPKRLDLTSSNIEEYFKKSLETGILNWQEMAHLDFQELVELARKSGSYLEEIE